MVCFPFIYFSILLLYILSKKKTFELSAYLVSLYVISSFCSILIDLNDLRSFDTQYYRISFIPTIVYCFLLTLTIWPFYRFKSERITNIKVTKPKQFDYIVYIYFCAFLLIFFTSLTNIVQVLSGDLGALRYELVRLEDISNNRFASNPIIITAGILGDFSIIMLLFYFISLSFLKRSKLFNTICFLSSMAIVIMAIEGVDRSKVLYWLITYGAMLVLFWKRMSKKQQKNISIASIIILSLAVSYFLVLTFSRFDAYDTGSKGSMISYAGQPFINFCFFFDKVKYGEFSLQRIFPLFYKLFIHNGINDTVNLNVDISLKTGKEIGVFSTFIGDIMVASGKIAGTVYCIAFYIAAYSIVKFRTKAFLHFYQILFVFCLITIPMLGVFTHFYANFTRTLPFLLFILYAFYLKYDRLKGT
jgi:oligosaccharide repeat unit polymerase